MKKLVLILCTFFAANISLSQTHEQEILEFQNKLNADYSDPEKPPLNAKQKKKSKGHEFFPINEKYKVVADFEKVDDAMPFLMKTTTNRLPEYKIFGYASFQLNGENYKVPVYQSVEIHEGYEDHLFFPFTDLTNGEETYTGGRYIDLTIPEKDTIVIDFNKAYNPYCAYNGRYSCPIPPEENQLDTAVHAGIKAPN